MKISLKNPWIEKFLALFNAFMSESMQKRRLFHTKRPSVSRRHRDAKAHIKWYRFATQRIRREIIRVCTGWRAVRPSPGAANITT